MTPKELEFAKKWWWYQFYKHRKADRSVEPFLKENLASLELGQKSKLQAAREALFISQAEMARRLEITAHAYKVIEENESKGTVTLQSLHKAAEALDCEIIYGLRPKTKKLFSQILWEKIEDAAKEDPFLKLANPQMKTFALAAFAQRCIENGSFSRRAGWSLKRKK
jgi:transcriptional regulator with XRE-family HTH domain